MGGDAGGGRVGTHVCVCSGRLVVGKEQLGGRGSGLQAAVHGKRRGCCGCSCHVKKKSQPLCPLNTHIHDECVVRPVRDPVYAEYTVSCRIPPNRSSPTVYDAYVCLYGPALHLSRPTFSIAPFFLSPLPLFYAARKQVAEWRGSPSGSEPAAESDVLILRALLG